MILNLGGGEESIGLKRLQSHSVHFYRFFLVSFKVIKKKLEKKTFFY